jgi:hypothetical protein
MGWRTVIRGRIGLILVADRAFSIPTGNWNQVAYSVVSPFTKFSNGGSAYGQAGPRAYHSPAQPQYTDRGKQ